MRVAAVNFFTRVLHLGWGVYTDIYIYIYIYIWWLLPLIWMWLSHDIMQNLCLKLFITKDSTLSQSPSLCFNNVYPKRRATYKKFIHLWIVTLLIMKPLRGTSLSSNHSSIQQVVVLSYIVPESLLDYFDMQVIWIVNIVLAHTHTHIAVVDRVFANGPIESYQRLQKWTWYLLA